VSLIDTHRGLSVGEGSHNLIYRVVPRVPQVANKGVSSKYGVATRFWNNLHQVRSRSEDWKAKFFIFF
jgi:hypothetical protein